MKIVNRTLMRTILLAFSLASVMMLPVAAEGVGVKVGDWVKYSDFSFTWNMPEGAEEPSELTIFDLVDWAKAEVLNVEGTNVNTKFTTHFKNGTESSETNSYDVKTGTGAIPFLTEANLDAGAQIPGELLDMELYINGTTSRTYAGVSRNVNYVDIASTQYGSTGTLKLYWDKAKGVLCELLLSFSMTYGATTYSMLISFKMTETNMWSAGLLPAILTEYWMWAIIVPVIAAICIVAYVIRLRARSPPPP